MIINNEYKYKQERIYCLNSDLFLCFFNLVGFFYLPAQDSLHPKPTDAAPIDHVHLMRASETDQKLHHFHFTFNSQGLL